MLNDLQRESEFSLQIPLEPLVIEFTSSDL
jgi:hypothetical protein